MGCGCKKKNTQTTTTNSVVVKEGTQTQQINVNDQQLNQIIDKINQLNNEQG
jgi:hypothetical protein